MRHALLVLLATALPTLGGCVAADGASSELVTAAAAEPVLLLVTVRSGDDTDSCVAAADAIDGIDTVVALPRLSTFVSASDLSPTAALAALRALACVESARFDDALQDEADQFCLDRVAEQCARMFECLTPEEIADYSNGFIETEAQCVTLSQQFMCPEQCPGFDPVLADTCMVELDTSSCELIRLELLEGMPQFPVCDQACAR